MNGILKNLARAVLILVVFGVCFFMTTAVCDWICWHTGYYDEAAKMAVELEY